MLINLLFYFIQSLEYLDMVINKALRLFPVTIMERLSVKDYPVPNTNFTIPKGMLVGIANQAIMRDLKYFPDQDNFNPDLNFDPETKQQWSPYAFLAFGQ